MNYQYKNTGVQWLGEIPDHWDVTTIKNHFHVIPSNVDKKIKDNEIPVELCNYVDVYYNDFVDLSIDFMEVTANAGEVAKFQLKEKDVLITKDSEDPLDIGVPAIINEVKDKLLCGYHLSMLRAKSNKITGDYLLWLLKDASIASQLWREATGVTRWAIASRHIKNSTIPLPSKEEQNEITDYLKETCDRIDTIIEIKEKQLKQITAVKKSRIEEIIKFGIETNESNKTNTNLDYLPQIRSGWIIDRFKDVAKLRKEKTDEKSEIENYLELEDISQGTGEILNKRNTLEVVSKVTKFHKGDVIFGKLRPYLEKYAYVDFDGLCTGEILAFKPERIEGKYLMYVLSSNWFINLCNSMSYGAKMPRVNWNTQLSKVYLPIPTKQEQQGIIKILDDLTNKTNQLSKKIVAQTVVLKNYKQNLIHECVTGKKQIVKTTSKETI